MFSPEGRYGCVCLHAQVKKYLCALRAWAGGARTCSRPSENLAFGKNFHFPLFRELSFWRGPLWYRHQVRKIILPSLCGTELTPGLKLHDMYSENNKQAGRSCPGKREAVAVVEVIYF